MTVARPAPAVSAAARPPYPNFLIVGVMKAATTALAFYLSRHPQIHLPNRELHFFDRADRYQRGADYYCSQFTPAPRQHVVGEKTPTYSYHPDCARRIAAFNPHMRLLWVFRNPVDRAYSHYWYFVQNGQEALSFEEALAREAERRRANIGFSYLDRGRYSAQVERYLALFPPEHMLFLLHEDFRRAPNRTVERALDFLGLPFSPGLTAGAPPRNVTRLPRFPAVQRLAYQLFYARFPAGYRFVHRLNTRGRPGYPPLPAHLRNRLKHYYAADTARLATLTGLDVSNWQ